MNEQHRDLGLSLETLRDLETKFATHLQAGDLDQWSRADIMEAIRLSLHHKDSALKAIDRNEMGEAISELRSVIWIMSGFVEAVADAGRVN